MVIASVVSLVVALAVARVVVGTADDRMVVVT